jgi:hypothetical protein
MMNSKQLIVAALIGIALALAFAYMPHVHEIGDRVVIRYYWIVDRQEGRPYIALLLVQWLGICLIGGLGLAATANRSSK